MNKHKYSKSEMDAWKRGKIAAYYAEKARQRRQASERHKLTAIPKYSNYNADSALELALKRTYGGNK